MKKRYISSLLVLLILSAFLITNKVQANSTRINKTKVNLYIGGTYQLEIYSTSNKIAWSSTDKSIVKVNKKGTITGVSNGKAKVKAKVGQKTYSYSVTVKDKVEYTIEINDEYIKLTYSPNFNFTKLQSLITYYDNDGKVLWKTRFVHTKVACIGDEVIDEDELPPIEYAYYEISFITK